MEVRVTLRGRETVSLTLQPGDTVPELKQQIHIAGGGFPPDDGNPIDMETDSRDDEQSVFFFVGFGVGDVRTPRAARG